jgi:hypothetical protein
MSWYDRAACKGMNPAAFWPEHGKPFAHRELCNTCPVQPDCLDAGIEEETGWWGGQSPRQRQARRVWISRITGNRPISPVQPSKHDQGMPTPHKPENATERPAS